MKKEKKLEIKISDDPIQDKESKLLLREHVIAYAAFQAVLSDRKAKDFNERFVEKGKRLSEAYKAERKYSDKCAKQYMIDRLIRLTKELLAICSTTKNGGYFIQRQALDEFGHKNGFCAGKKGYKLHWIKANRSGLDISKLLELNGISVVG